jgi:hypothetical protein
VPSEIEEMDCGQLHWMQVYFERKFAAEKKAMDDSRSKARRR